MTIQSIQSFNPLPPTQRQYDFIKSLIAQRDTSRLELQIAQFRAKAVAGQLTRSEASTLIDWLKEQPRKEVENVPTPEPLEEGVYSVNGALYKVVESNEGRLYAKVWKDEEWVYAPGAIGHIKAADRISAEEAAKFGRLTGSCVFCSRRLTDERSATVGYGPVCAERVGLPWGEVHA